jgi:hypothetical protein
VDVFTGKSDICRGRSVPLWNAAVAAAPPADNFTPFLRRIVFIGEATDGCIMGSAVTMPASSAKR